MPLKEALSRISQDWKDILFPIYKSDLYKDGIKELNDKLIKEEEEYVIFPPSHLYLEALRITPYHSVKVVFLGQDPYIHENQAMGLSFSVPEGIFLPPSLQNIFSELENDLGIKKTNGDLTWWGQQGVLLLNTTLSVRQGKIFSHKDLGWQKNITTPIITSLNTHPRSIIFVLMGSHAIKYESVIDTTKHKLIMCSHPSPLSVHKPVGKHPPFRGSKIFSKINTILKEHKQSLIEW